MQEGCAVRRERGHAFLLVLTPSCAWRCSVCVPHTQRRQSRLGARVAGCGG